MSKTQNAAGRRITSLLDANSFVEIGAKVTARSTDFNLSAAMTPSDGVITGYGTIDGSLVYIYSQDAAVLGGTVGEMHARKITQIYRMARKMGAPVIGLLDCGGIRLEESTDALAALGALMKSQAMCSGLVPQITAVFGSCGGGLSVLPALSDFTFLASDSSLFVNAPDAIVGKAEDEKDPSSADFQMKSGNADFTGTEAEVCTAIRELVSYLPLNNEDEGECVPVRDDLNRACTGLRSVMGDAEQAVRMIADSGLFFETKRGFAKCVTTGFIRLNGYTVGVVANNGGDGQLCAEGLRKASKFVGICDAFNIPVLTLVNASHFRASVDDEKRIPKTAALLAYAYAGATVPKVTVVMGKAYGSAYVLMGSKALGADLVFAWPDAEIGTMDAKMAAKILCGGADAETLKKTAGEYAALQQSAESAARRGYVDTIISDEDTRKYVIGAFEMLYTKREDRPDKKHGTV